MAEDSAVKVCVRFRPLIKRNEGSTSENVEPVQLYWKSDKKSIYQTDDGNSSKSFSFDRVFTADETTDQLYRNIAKPLVVSTVGGYNGTIFAYGQTSSGKTFTMMGNNHILGVIPLAVEDVFQTIKTFPKKEFLLRVSYMEIYNETVTDLLVDSWKRKPLEVRESINKNIYVADLTEELVTSPAQALAWIRKGEKNRHYGSTKLNQRSSRSHTIFRMILESRERSDSEAADGAIIVSHLNLVDLAGSERASQTGAEGARFKEGCNINRSLFTLGQVIKKLTDENQKGFTNYRDSKLTRILQNSLGGNAKTVIICTVTAAALDETLSTLQFASTAKKMKNDPHVTEVSDDGALLKRYRNEIEDLKRRLNEVSSVTQTTATEKEVLSQLLQEKDQLQREQEDRIKNLTKLLVTGSNLVPVKRMPKRRVTWGGKMLRLAPEASCSPGLSDHSFAELSTQKRKADRSCMLELIEEDEDFDSNWGIPEEPSDDMDFSQASVTVRSFGDSPKDVLTPDRVCELSGKVSSLEHQVEVEGRQKEEAMAEVQTLNARVSELELQLQEEAQQQQEVTQKAQAAEQKAAELDLQLQTEAQHKQEATEKVEMLEFRVIELEKRLEEQGHTQKTHSDQMTSEFAESVQLCERLSSEKDAIVAERDYLQQEVGMCMEQIHRLEKEKAAVSQELEEQREMEEFQKLEEEFKKDHEAELQDEISSLKKASESFEIQCLELQNKLEAMSEDLKKKTEEAEELQNMCGKDLVKEVAMLRRSLDDAEGVGRDTKKEWAFLRSRNIALEERDVTLSTNHEKMEAEVKGLRSQLETEKTHFKKMQSDLQKELNVAFMENTKLITLLDGKVPKNLIDSVELERTVSQLNKELAARSEAEAVLKAQLEELDSLRQLPVQVDQLSKQLEESEHHRASLSENLSDLQQAMTDLEVKLADTEESRTTEEEISKELQQQVNQLTEELQSKSSEHASAQSLAEEVEKLLSVVTCMSAERDQLKANLQEKEKDVEVEGRLHQEQLQHNCDQINILKQRESDLEQEVVQLSQELQRLRDEQDGAMVSSAHSSAEELDKLLSTVEALTAERDQLKVDMQENVDMMIENQEELRAALEKNRKQKELIEELESAQSCKQDSPDTDANAQLDQLHIQITQLNASIHTVTEQKKQLEEDLQHSIHMVSTTQELLKSVQEELCEQKQINCDLKALRRNEETLEQQIQTLTEKLQSTEAERDHLLSEKQDDSHSSSQEMEKLLCTLTALREERDQLQNILEELRQDKQQLKAQLDEQALETQTRLHALQEELHEQKQKSSALMKNTSEELQSVKAVLNERTQDSPSSSQDMDQLLCTLTTVTEERDQLQDILEELRQDKRQMRSQLEEQVDTLQAEITQLNASVHTVTEQKRQLEEDLQHNIHMVSTTQELLKSVQEELCEQKQINCDLKALTCNEETLEQQIQTLTEKLQSTEAERDHLLSEKQDDSQSSSQEMEKLLCTLTALREERDQLQNILEELRQDKQQLKAQLEEEVSTTQELLKSVQEELCEQKQINCDLKALGHNEENLEQQIQTLTEKLQSTEAERDHLLSDKQDDSQSSSQEMEKLICTLTALKEERDQLQNILEELRQDKQQLKAQLEEQITQLNVSVHTVTEQKRQLEEDLQHNIHMVSTTQELLKSVQEELCEQKQINCDLKALRHNEETLEQQIQTLTEKLQSTETERDHLLSEKQDDSQSSSQEMEKLLCTLTALKEERDQLQNILEELRQDKQQLKAQLEEEITQLNVSVHTVTEQKRQLEEDLQHNIHMVSTTQELLKSIQEELCEQKQINCDLKALRHNEETLEQQIQTLTEKLQSTEAERDRLLSDKQDDSQSSSQEMEKLICTLTTLKEERDQLQNILEELRQDKQQLKAQLEEQITQLNVSVHTVTEQKRQLEEDLQHNIHMVSTTQELLKSVQEELCEQKQINCDLKALRHKEEALEQQMQTLTEKLQSTEAERDHLLSEKQDDSQSSSQEMEKLVCTLTALKEERDQLQNILEELRQDKQQLKAQLEEQVQESKEQLQMLQEKQSHAEAEASQQLLSEANRTISELREQLRCPDQSTCNNKELLSSLLHNSTLELQTYFQKLQDFKETCSSFASMAMDRSSKAPHSMSLLPKSTPKLNCTVGHLRQQCLETLDKITVHLQTYTQHYKVLFDTLVNKDLDIFEERRLQDLLLCKAQAPSYSITDKDFHSLWKSRVTELLDKRQFYLQKMGGTVEKLQTNMVSLRDDLIMELTEREQFKKMLETVNDRNMEEILNSELERRSALLQARTRTLQVITEEHNILLQELKQLETQSHCQLQQEKSKRCTLLKALEGAPLQTQLDLLKENQHLLLKLQQAEDHNKCVQVENEELKEAQVKASQCMSNHKQATQLLQTELQDSRAQVQDKDQLIQSLKSTVHQLQKNASPSAVELEKLKTQVLKMEADNSLSSDKHQQEILKLTTSLNEKEESLRRLKLNLRSSQQLQDESFLQGKDLHAKLIKPKGVVVQSSIALEKIKLEEEVSKLELKNTELQSVVSSQKTEINKWKNRAIKMKGQMETTRAQSPCAPLSKRRPLLLPDSELLLSPKKVRFNPNQILDSPGKGAESPRKGPESPNISMLNSPKSRIFDTEGSSELLSRNCPKQFFDNSALGTIPGASVETEQKEWWSQWPKSPKQDDICKTQ